MKGKKSLDRDCVRKAERKIYGKEEEGNGEVMRRGMREGES